MSEKRGRPKETESKPILKYKQVFKNEDGTTTTWHWDKIKFPNGPIKIETSYPNGYETPFEKQEKINKKLPKTQRRYINPENGKKVGYGRAKQLGLI